MTTLKIAKDLNLPLEIVTERSAFIGRTGQGKSYAAQKLAELVYAAGGQFIVLDPVGIWFGLRLAANGKDPGLEIPVIGGLHGDIPLEPGAGKLLADLAVDRRLSMVLDVSQIEHDTDRNRFAREFGDRFFFRKKAAPSAVLLFLEEGQEFIPQNPGPKETDMLRTFTRLAKIGRNFGVGVSVITQRPQEVNKKVLNLTELLFAFQLNGKHERKAVEDWIEDKAIDEDIGAELPKLEPWHPHAWSPSWLKISKVVAISPRWTFDASSTPKVGSKAEVKELAPIDLEQLRKQMAATIEKQKAEDPKELRRRIAELERTLKNISAQKPVPPIHPKGEVRVKEVPVLKDGQLARVERLADRYQKALGEASDSLGKAAENVKGLTLEVIALRTDIQQRLGSGNGDPRIIKPPLRSPGFVRTTDSVRTPSNRIAPLEQKRPSSSGEGERLPPGERATLIAAAQYPDGVQRNELTVLTGYKRSSRDAYIARLTQKGYLETGQHGAILATQAGINALGSSYEPLPVGSQLLEYWRGRLPEGERKVLDVLVEAYPDVVERSVIDEITGYKRSSRDAYLARMSSKRLVESDRGAVRASSLLFDRSV